MTDQDWLAVACVVGLTLVCVWLHDTLGPPPEGGVMVGPK